MVHNLGSFHHLILGVLSDCHSYRPSRNQLEFEKECLLVHKQFISEPHDRSFRILKAKRKDSAELNLLAQLLDIFPSATEYHTWQYPPHIEMDGCVCTKVLRFIIIIIVAIVIV